MDNRKTREKKRNHDDGQANKCSPRPKKSMRKITLVRPKTCINCYRCEGIKRALGRLKAEFPDIEIEEIDALSEEGIKLVRENQITYTPGVFLNGKFIGMGEMKESDLRPKLAEK